MDYTLKMITKRRPIQTQPQPKCTQTNNPHQLDREFYVKAYKDINPRFTNPFTHYYSVGIYEERLPNANKFLELYPLFDIDVYISQNLDLSKLTREELMSHYHHKGRFECRVYRKLI